MDSKYSHIGRYENKIRTKEIDPELYNFTNNPNVPAKEKILMLDTKQTFDSFTNKYGFIDNRTEILFAHDSDLDLNSNKNVISIKWEKVAKDFKGIGISICLLSPKRFMYAFFNENKYVSWWDDTFYHDICEFV
jgi:hypothetical protein